MITTGDNIRTMRLLRGMMQYELARAAGIAPETLSRYENGKRVPTSPALARIAKALNVSMDALWCEQDNQGTGVVT